MILIAIGANLDHPRFGPPLATCEAALAALEEGGVTVLQCSRWYRSAPVPASDQPWFINGVAKVATDLEPLGLLAVLHHIEADFGRERRERNEARLLDLDLLAYDDYVSKWGEALELPHPRLAERAFVLLPLAELAPDWRHPVSGRTVAELIRDLPPGQAIEPLAD